MKITLCENPFDLTRDQRLLAPAATIGELIERDDLDGRYVVSCNGELLPPETTMAFAPRESDDVQLVPQLTNSTLRTIAVIGIAVAAAAFAGPLGGLLASTFGVAAGATTTAIAGALISVAGNLAVAGFASLFSPGAGGQSYGVLGPSTTSRSGIPIPKGYGTFRAAGNIVESWVDIQGDNGDEHDVDDGADRIGRQYINCRVDFGWGPAASIDNLQLNGKDISSYADVAYVLLLGTNDQTAVTVNDPRWVVLNRTTQGTTTNNQPTTGFDTINNNYPLNQRVRAGIATNFVVQAGQRSDTQKLTVYVTFLRGCWRTDDSGVQKRLAIYYRVYYRPAGSGNAGWVLAPGGDHAYINIQTTILRQATIIDGLAPGRYDTKVEKLGSGAPGNDMDAFEHESNKFGDELWVESVQETSYTTLAYPNSIQVCLRFMASGQLSGSDVNLQADITYLPRSTMPAELAGLDNDNPAVAAYDILHDDVIGMDLPDSRIDLDWLLDMADLSDTRVDDGDGGTQKLCRFRGIFDQPNVNCWKALQAVCSLARSHPQRIGTRITGWIDQPDVPVQMFHVGNILLDSYEKTWLDLEDRAQEVVVNFADATDNYKTRNPVRVVRAADQSSEDTLKQTSVSLLGCDDRVQAYYWAVLQLHHNVGEVRKHKWQSNRQAIRCRTGNVVLLQHDSPTAAWGGLVEPGSDASTLMLDRLDLPFDPGTDYSVVVQVPALKRLTCVVAAVSGNLLTLAGYDGTAVNRVVLGTVDVGILSIASSSGGLYLFTVDDAAGIASGAAVELWMTDPLVSLPVTAVNRVLNGETGHACSLVTLGTPLPVAPEEWCSYVYQSTARQAIKVRLTGVTKRLGEQRYTLSATDYSDETYVLPPPVSGESYTPPPSSGPSPGNPGAATQAVLSVAYQVNQDGTYSVTDIVIQAQGANYTSGSTAKLISDYDEPQPSGPDLTDPTQNLQLTTGGTSGQIVQVTGFDTSTEWHEIPYVVLSR